MFVSGNRPHRDQIEKLNLFGITTAIPYSIRTCQQLIDYIEKGELDPGTTQSQRVRKVLEAQKLVGKRVIVKKGRNGLKEKTGEVHFITGRILPFGQEKLNKGESPLTALVRLDGANNPLVPLELICLPEPALVSTTEKV